MLLEEARQHGIWRSLLRHQSAERLTISLVLGEQGQGSQTRQVVPESYIIATHKVLLKLRQDSTMRTHLQNLAGQWSKRKRSTS